jgi:4-amino-4-deoxy-L-arabinose transferase-like glycosyltransferase
MRMDHIKITKKLFSPLSLTIASALLFRLAIVVFFTPPLLQDETEYLAIAQSLYHGNGFSIDGAPTAYRAPVYPAFIATVFTAIGESVVAIRILQALADTLTCVLLFLLCKRFFSENTALLAITIYSFFPGNALYVSLLMTEVLFITLTLFAILLYSNKKNEYSIIEKILLGVILAILTLLKQNGALFIIIFLLWDIIRTHSLKKVIYQNVIMLISFIIFLSPWLIRNKMQFDHYSITSNGGINFWIGHNQSSNGSFKYLRLNNPLELVSGEFDRSSLGYKEGAEFLIHHPAEEVKLLFLKFAHFFEPDFALLQSLQYKPEWKQYQKSILVYREFSPFVLLVLHCLTMIVIVAGLWGLIFANDSKYQYLLLVRLIIVFWICSHLVYFGVARFRLPIMPLFIAMTAFSFESWQAKTFSVTRLKLYLFLILTFLLFASWIATFFMLYCQ